MLRLMETGFYGDENATLYREIAARVEDGKRTLLLVPEQQTVLAESEMAGLLPGSAPLCFEATNFTRFANTVFRTIGGLAGETASRGKRALIMWRVLNELAPVLPSLGGRDGSVCEVSAGLVEKSLAAVGEMQSLGIGADALAEAAESGGIADRRLSDKVADLSHIMALYKKTLSETFRDVDDILLRLAEKLGDAPDAVRDTYLYLDGFTSFTEPQYRVIEKLLTLTDVTVALTLPHAGREALLYAEVRETRERLLRIADRAGCEKKSITLPPLADGRRAYLADVCDLLWRSRGVIDNNALHNKDTLRLFTAETPYEACDFIAADIRRWVMAGDRYRDCAVVMRNADSYAGILDVAFEKAGVPAFLSRRRDATTFEVVKLIRAAYAAVAGGYDRTDVMNYAKCSLCGVGRQEIDEFELYTEVWQITGARFTDGMTWNMDPRGYQPKDGTPCEIRNEKLRRINDTRERLIRPLLSLAERTGTTTVREHAAALFSLLSEIGTEKQLSEKADRLYALGEYDAARDTARVFETVCDTLDDLCEILGDTIADARTFLGELDVLFSYTDVGHIPSYYDTVTAGAADLLRLSGKKHVYLLGVNQGVFPGTVSEGIYFTDRDRATLSALGLGIAPENETKRARELFIFSRAFAAGEETVTLVSERRDAAYNPTAASDVLSRIREITGGEVAPVTIADLPLSDRLYTPDYALEHPASGVEGDAVRRALEAAGYGELASRAAEPILNDALHLGREAIGILYGRELLLSQTKIERFLSCPMSYYCHYHLKLDEGERATFDLAHIGTFVHAVLENFFRTLKERGTAVADLTPEEKDALVRRVAEAHLAAVFEDVPEQSPRMRAMTARLVRATMPVVDGLCREFADCAFTPIFFELPIDDRNPALPDAPAYPLTDGRTVRVRGAIDRVDAYRDEEDVYIRVVDYKTGAKDFKPEELAEGRNLQMFLYLKAVVETDKPAFRSAVGVPEGGRMIPAGVIYVKASLTGATVEHADAATAAETVQKLQKRQGMLLDDPVSLHAMNTAYLPVRFKKDGTLDQRSAKYVYSAAGWQEIDRTVSHAVTEIAERMCRGEIDALPQRHGGSTTCKHCPFKPVCRNPVV